MAAPASVHPEQILKDLRELWASLEQDQADGGGVLRACSMTLAVTAGDEADTDLVRQTLGVLMHNHPSRAVIVRDIANAAEMTAHIFSECWKPFGSSQQICSEGIEITPGAGPMDELARFIVPLRAPDLPFVLWRRGALGRENRRFDGLIALADKVVFDTFETPDAVGAMSYLRGLQAAGKRIADLNWTRLTGWREIIAHLFDDRAVLPEAVTSVNIAYGGGRMTTCALYIASWIRTGLPGAPVIVDAVSAPARPPGGLVSIEFTTDTGRLALHRTENGCVEVTGVGRNYHSTLPPVRLEDLMREELGILGPDRVFERVLAA
jgi:glucose-6-phosphate dehydrogenase assembly protein OpcA